MPKEQFRETDVANKISGVSFAVESAAEMQRLAQIHIVAKNLYNQDAQRTPITYGVLDRRLGTCNKDTPCQTCGKNIYSCVGHYGYIDLELPVFHVGYFSSIITILQSICKMCAHLLLSEDIKSQYRLKLANPNLDYKTKRNIRSKIVALCKKVSKCPNCKETNGSVKKMPRNASAGNTLLKIVYEEHRTSGKAKENLFLKDNLERFQFAMECNPDLRQMLMSGSCNMSQTLTPLDVLNIFQRIPASDILFLAMDRTKCHPKDLILTRMLVAPVNIRPSVVSDVKAGSNEDDLTMRQSEIIFVNDVIRRHKLSGASENLFLEGWDFLQLQTALYINSEISGIPLAMMPKKPGRGLVQRLKGKQGRFRGNLSGKRVDFSSRTVISPDPTLQIDQVGVPLHIAKVLTFPERVNAANIKRMRQLIVNGSDKWPGANYVQQKGSPFLKYLKYGNREKLAQELKYGDLVERHLCDDDIVLFNRQPSLHKLSIMAHRVKVHRFRTFRFNECACNPYNADFDGDEMNLHLPQTEEAKAEALFLLGNKYNLVTPRNGELLIAATQDFLTGAYRITKKNTFLTYRQVAMLYASLMADDDINTEVDLPLPCILKPERLWSGKQIFSLVLRCNKKSDIKVNLEIKGKAYTRDRELCCKDSYIIVRNSELLAGTLEKGHLGSGGKVNNIFYLLLRDYGEEHAIRSMWRLGKMASIFLLNTGFSIGIGDVTAGYQLNQRKQRLLDDGYFRCDHHIKSQLAGTLQCQPGCSTEETLEAMMLKELSVIREQAGQACLLELNVNNSPLIMALCGSKGSFINISQMIACVGQQALNGKRVPDGFENRSLPHFKHNSKTPDAKGFVQNSFYSGLTPTEFYFHTMGGREGLVDTAVKTAETGYMQRRLMKALEDLVVHYDSTVRNAESGLVQVSYGGDGLDPSFMEDDAHRPVDFQRLLRHIQAKHPYRAEKPLDSSELRRAMEELLADPASLSECNEIFKQNIRDFVNQLANKLSHVEKHYKNALSQTKSNSVVREIYRLTCSQLVAFVETCNRKFMRSTTEPGTAVGALAGQSIGEPGTQMTLKTFHFAGVASMNITQGVPRIKEIINATKQISTPIITTTLTNDHDEGFARLVKARIERTVLGDITTFISEVFTKSDNFLLIQLNQEKIHELKLEITADSIKYSICSSKLKLKSNDVVIESESIITIRPSGSKAENRCNFILNELKSKLPFVIIKGLLSVSRAVITKCDKGGKSTYSLCVEGDNLREVMATWGVCGTKTISNNIIEVYHTLGIEAARETIVREIKMVMENHGMSVDIRHIMLLAAQMTHTGEVLGITRFGLSKMKQSVLNLASFEKTADHLFDAAYYGQTDSINGVSESIIMGNPPPIGTGMFKLLHKANVEETSIQVPPTLLFT